jgi:hypothetical protein
MEFRGLKVRDRRRIQQRLDEWQPFLGGSRWCWSDIASGVQLASQEVAAEAVEDDEWPAIPILSARNVLPKKDASSPSGGASSSSAVGSSALPLPKPELGPPSRKRLLATAKFGGSGVVPPPKKPREGPPTPPAVVRRLRSIPTPTPPPAPPSDSNLLISQPELGGSGVPPAMSPPTLPSRRRPPPPAPPTMAASAEAPPSDRTSPPTMAASAGAPPSDRTSPIPGFCVNCGVLRSHCFSDGDWLCKECGNHNYHRHDHECSNFRCRARFPQAASTFDVAQPEPQEVARDVVAAPVDKKWCTSCRKWRVQCVKLHDWFCECGNHCFARKMVLSV